MYLHFNILLQNIQKYNFLYKVLYKNIIFIQKSTFCMALYYLWSQNAIRFNLLKKSFNSCESHNPGNKFESCDSIKFQNLVMSFLESISQSRFCFQGKSFQDKKRVKLNGKECIFLLYFLSFYIFYAKKLKNSFKKFKNFFVFFFISLNTCAWLWIYWIKKWDLL